MERAGARQATFGATGSGFFGAVVGVEGSSIAASGADIRFDVHADSILSDGLIDRFFTPNFDGNELDIIGVGKNLGDDKTGVGVELDSGWEGGAGENLGLGTIAFVGEGKANLEFVARAKDNVV